VIATRSSAAAAALTHRETPLGGGRLPGWELPLYKLDAFLTRLTHWEFWPSWVTYAPLVPYILWLGVRHWRVGGVMACTHANPGIPLGGIVGESKWDILQLLPAESIVPCALITPGPLDERLAHLNQVVRERAWTWPIVLKPDVGQRGQGVCIIAGPAEARKYLARRPGRVLAQAYHPGPFEAGVFFVRLPTEHRGRIFSITDKRFPTVVGDGRSTIRALVWRHPRYRVQARAHLANLGARTDEIPAAGERVKLGDIGNHCRGSLFLDGSHLITPGLTKAIDQIAQRAAGFFFGRFDIRYSDPEALKRGEGFRIVELNGLLSESTNIYDPGTSFWSAQRTLREQWRLAFAVGACCRSAGTRPGRLYGAA
jgi:hypothetical protein